MGGGVAGAIKRRGGEEIEREAMARGPIEPGAAVATTAGRLKAKYCIHAATMGQNLETDAALIGRATRSALEQAARLELNTVAFPALGTGVGGFPVDEAAQVMIAETLSHHQSSPLPGTVVFVLFDRRAYEAFSRALAAKPAT
jgi:O-acetyl-ADP-ribose deacetylase (regulator of RNase III)